MFYWWQHRGKHKSIHVYVKNEDYYDLIHTIHLIRKLIWLKHINIYVKMTFNFFSENKRLLKHIPQMFSLHGYSLYNLLIDMNWLITMIGLKNPEINYRRSSKYPIIHVTVIFSMCIFIIIFPTTQTIFPYYGLSVILRVRKHNVSHYDNEQLYKNYSQRHVPRV